ncbi:ABC transporter substrate-binding protein [Pelistega ratti]|uniref:ABC transporter substrate-binding protein n=1 Tax=Pelistega ratti TaxID=2652177 RepID=UPI00135BFF10|nr:ABC transporter substrate-binding protein [Pelistega ratti]
MQSIMKYSVLSATIIFGLSTTAFAAKVPEGTVLAEKQEITVNNGTEPQSFDPNQIAGGPESQVALQLFEGLVTADEDGNIIPGVAVSWEHSPDFKQWTFKLRPEAKWSNGDPVTAHDFVFAWQRLVTPATAAPYASYLEFLQIENANEIIEGKKSPDTLGIKAVDDYTLQLTLNNPVPYLVSMTAHPSVFPLPQKVIEKFGDSWVKKENIVGNGAYKLVDHVINGKIVFERNPFYWNDKETVIDKATFLAIESGVADVQRYRAGDLDVNNGLPAELYAKLKKEIPNEIFNNRILTTYTYDINHSKPPFNDIRVRKALNLALDRNIITDKVLGQGQIPTYVFTPPYINEGHKIQQPAYANQSMQERSAEAIKLLEEAGFSQSNPLKFTILYNTSEGHKKIAIAVASIWKKNTNGLINVKLENQEWKTFLDTRRQGNYEIALSGWGADYNQATTFTNYFLSDSSQNSTFYKSKAYDDVITNAYKIEDSEARAEAYAKAEQILADDFALIPFYNYVRVRLIKPYVGGYTGKDPLARVLLQNLYIKK